MKYRPWGSIDWALSLSTQHQWQFVGVIGTEVRSLCAWRHMHQQKAIAGELLAEIQDVESEKYRERTEAALTERRADFLQAGGSASAIRNFPLMAELYVVNAFANAAAAMGSSLVLDITSFPKRFFFLILKTLIKNTGVRNLLVTYTSPSSYVDDGQPLYEDIEQWKTLPGYGGSSNKPELWIVSVGFLVESLRQYVGDNPNDKMKLLIPFPAPLSTLRRTWQSVSELEERHSQERFEKYRVDPLDISAAFDRITSLIGTPQRNVAFAPFGPKPTSVAMCLYAMQREDQSSAHYPQPTVYHPDYSIGIRKDDPSTAVNAYWIKHDGEFLYGL